MDAAADAADQLLQELGDRLKAPVARSMRGLRRYQPPGRAVQAYDLPYMMERTRLAHGRPNDAIFTIDSALAGLATLVHRLFGVRLVAYVACPRERGCAP